MEGIPLKWIEQEELSPVGDKEIPELVRLGLRGYGQGQQVQSVEIGRMRN